MAYMYTSLRTHSTKADAPTPQRRMRNTALMTQVDISKVLVALFTSHRSDYSGKMTEIQFAICSFVRTQDNLCEAVESERIWWNVFLCLGGLQTCVLHHILNVMLGLGVCVCVLNSCWRSWYPTLPPVPASTWQECNKQRYELCQRCSDGESWYRWYLGK